jgi:hypothetical protein
METHRSTSRCAGDIVRSSFFLGAVDPFNSVDDSMKGCHVRGLSARIIQLAYVDWRGKHTCHAYQVSPTGCTLIQITTTLGYK